VERHNPCHLYPAGDGRHSRAEVACAALHIGISAVNISPNVASVVVVVVVGKFVLPARDWRLCW
jgi:hypothetical protein